MGLMAVLDALETVGQMSHLACRSLLALPGALLRPRLWLAQLHPILLGALPLGLTAGVAIGAVVWMHLRGRWSRWAVLGPRIYLPQALALAVVLEFAPLGGGIAGRRPHRG